MGETEIEMVVRHVAQGEGHIRKQLAIIQRLAARGLDTAGAQSVLATLERTQALHLEHLARLG